MAIGSHQPPSIGEALGKGFEIYKANFGPVFVGTLCAMVCGMIPVIGPFLVIPGMCYVALKAVRGQKISAEDGFIAFKALGDHIVIGLLSMCGIILCFVGIFITQPLFRPGFFYILDKKMSWSKAKDKCMSDVKPHLFSWFWFEFITGLVPALAGMLLCGVGIFLTLPIATCAMAYAYEKSLRDDEIPAGSMPINPQ